MQLMDCLGKQLLYFDGAMGTLLQEGGLPIGMAPDVANFTMPDVVRGVHARYLAAGANILKTNTFGCNALKMAGTGHTVPETVQKAVSLAREAIAQTETEGPHFVALDIGPSGKLLRPLGDLDFEEAVALFAEVARAGAAAGADCVLIETMSDTYELKAAVLAAKEVGLPVLATVTVAEKGRLLTGADMRAIAALLQGLRVQAMGLNCGFGAQALLPCLAQLRENTSLPLILNPNAGLPHHQDGKTFFEQSPQQFAEAASGAVPHGAWMLGGCCGTTPEHIAALIAKTRGMQPLPLPTVEQTIVSSGSGAVVIDGKAPVLIGERINPTGKPAMKRALQSGSAEYMLREAVKQQEAGVHILDVNAGLPGIDEAEALVRLVGEIQAVSDLPLQLDTANPQALEGAMRRYNGKPMVNSVSGKPESMQAVFPLVARYGGVVVALTLDEAGIPDTAAGRVWVAQKIIAEAAKYGIAKQDIIIDPLTMAVSAQPDAAQVVLEALSRIRKELGVQTVLGVSNISFGLPRRGALNTAFFTLAAGAGLSAAIMNPYAGEMMGAYHALCALLGKDVGCNAYVQAMGGPEAKDQPASVVASQTLRQAVLQGMKEEARTLAQQEMQTKAPMDIIEQALIPALNEVGEAFEKGKAFLPQLLMSAEAAKAAFDVLRQQMPKAAQAGHGKVIIATVQGDIHDIGKNIAKAMLENYQFDVIDLGRDVPPERVVQEARKQDIRLVGLSALMTTTVDAMAQTIGMLHEQCPHCRIMVGGAVLTPDYAKEIGADRHVRDAMDSVRYAQEVLGGA